MPHIPTNSPGVFGPVQGNRPLFAPELTDDEFREQFIEYCARFAGTEAHYDRVAPASGDSPWKTNRKFMGALATALVGIYGELTDLDARVLQLEETVAGLTPP